MGREIGTGIGIGIGIFFLYKDVSMWLKW